MSDGKFSKENKKGLALIGKGYKIIWELDKAYVLWNVINAIATAIIPFVALYFSAQVINILTSSKDLQKIIEAVIIVLISELILSFIREFSANRLEVHANQWNARLEIFFNEVNNKMPFNLLESSEVRLLKNKIKTNQNATSAGLGMLFYTLHSGVTSFCSIVLSIILGIGMFIKMLPSNSVANVSLNSPFLHIGVLTIIGLCIFGSLTCSNREFKKECDEWRKLPESNRLLNYFRRSLKDNFGAMDIRIYRQIDKIMEEINKWTIKPVYIEKISKLHNHYGKIRVTLLTIVDIIIYMFVGIKTYFGAFGIGNFIQYTGVSKQFILSVTEMCAVIGRLVKNTEYLQDTFDYLNLAQDDNKEGEKCLVSSYNIEFKDVYYKYPSNNTYTLNGISIKLDEGKKYAIVGENGSGKTTFVKLICRLYNPSIGQVLIDNLDVAKLKFKDFIKLISVVFQDFSLFSFSLGQNISGQVNYNSSSLEDIVKKTGFGDRYAMMKNGMNTNLYKDFDAFGEEISGGEAQKIAFARALYKNAPIMILDEPTAALDPISEYNLYSDFKKFANGKTAIFVSHRLCSCRFCDEILVFDKGKIIQHGTHTELLLDASGKYHELWNAQAQYYQDEQLQDDYVI